MTMPRDHASLERTPATSINNSLDWVPDPVEIYARRVLAGDIIAGPLVRAACTRHLHDLEHGSARGLVWRVEKAIRAINFFADVLRLPQVEVDKVSGEQLIDASMSRPFVLHLSQQFIVGSLFGWYNEDGARRFRTAFVEIGKGNGKSPLAAGIGLYMLTADGQANAEVYASAAVKDQAKIQYRDAVNMVDASDDLLEILEKHGEKEVYNLVNRRTKGFFKPISAEKRGLDGKRVHCSLIDELHEHPSSIVADKMRAGTKGMRNALVFEITNSGFDRTSVCYQHHEYSERVVLGDGIDDSWFAYVCGLDVGDDPLVDEGCWPKANPLLEVTIAPRYLRELVREARGMPAKASIVKRLNFCVWVDAENPAIDQDLWRAAEEDFDDEELAGAECLGALDLSGVWDLTALALLWRVGELIYLVVEFWTPKEGLLARAKRDRVPWDLWVSQGFITATPGRSVDYRFVAERLGDLQQRFGLQRLAFDPYRIKYLERELEQAGIELELVPHGQGFFKAAESGQWMPHSIEKFEELLAKGKLRVRKNPALAYAAASAVHEADPKGNRVYTKKRSRGRIDGVVAAAMVCGLEDAGRGEGIPDDYVPIAAE
jgi:phage terminase large subunit-like protein